jgi:hypothetical protein
MPRAWLAVLLLVGGLASSALAATAPVGSTLESWADTTHGWRFVGKRSNSGGWGVVEATENGGRSWHVILRVPAEFEIGLISRASATDGFAFVGSKVRTRRNRYLVTTDNGRHWKRLPPAALGFPIEATGRDLFWIRGGLDRRLYRAANALTGRWHPTIAATVPPHFVLHALQPVPRGAAALVQTAFDPGVREYSTKLLVYRNGKPQMFTVAQSDELVLCNDVIAFSVAWPVVTVGLKKAAPGPDGPQCNFNVGTAFFLSRDGGATWTSSETSTPKPG